MWKSSPTVSQVWRRNWACITPFFNYPPDIRRAIYTTNSVESLNRSLRKIIKTRGGFPNEERIEVVVSRATRRSFTGGKRSTTLQFCVRNGMPALERVAQ